MKVILFILFILFIVVLTICLFDAYVHGYRDGLDDALKTIDEVIQEREENNNADIH